MHASSSDDAEASVGKVLANYGLQPPAGLFGHSCRICDQSVAQCRAALARPCFRHRSYGLGDNCGGVRCVSVQDLDDLGYCHGVMMGMPAIVVRHHRDRNVANLCLASEL